MTYLRWDGSGAANVTGTVFTTCTGNLSFSDDDVRAVYIDWDDGTDAAGASSNKKEYANYQWVQLTNPTGNINVEHTYTATGTYRPVVQVVNSKGIVSPFLGSDATNTDVTPYYENSAHQFFKAEDGIATGIMRVENKEVLSGIDNSILDNQQPNDNQGDTAGDYKVYVLVAPLVASSSATNIGPLELEMEAEVDYSLVSTSDHTIAGGAGRVVTTLTKTIAAYNTTDWTGANEWAIAGGMIRRVLSLKWVNCKYTGSSGDNSYSMNQIYNKVKIFLIVKDTRTSSWANRFFPITYVTAGMPIKKVDDRRRFTLLDASQSRAKASNVANKDYFYDIGKVWMNPEYKWGATSGSSTSDEYYFFSNGDTKSWPVTDSQFKIAYAYDSATHPDGINGIDWNTTKKTAFDDNSTCDWVLHPDQDLRTNQFNIDDYGRFTPQYHLSRTSMSPSSSTSYPPATTGAAKTSSIYANKPAVLRITPGIKDDAQVSGDFSLMKMNEGGATQLDFTANYTDENWKNGSSNQVSLSGMNAQTFKDLANNTRTDNEYILVLWPKKTNKVFLNMANFNYDLNSSILGSDGTSAAPANTWGIAGISYLAIENSGTTLQNAYWKSVPFEDTTSVELEFKDDTNEKYINYKNGLSQSGYVSFDMPTDWYSTTLENLCGGAAGQFDTTTITSGSGDIIITGSVVDKAADGTFGKYLEFTRTGGDLLSSFFGTKREVGAFRYIAFVTNTGSSAAAGCINAPVWVAGADGANGCDGLGSSSKIYLMYGKDNASSGAGATVTYNPANLDTNTGVVILMRRINIYDAITGFSKIGNSDDNYTTPAANQYPPVDTDRVTASTSNFPQTYPFKASQTLTNQVKTYWSGATNGKYLMKIDLKGSSPLDSSTSKYEQYPMLYNIIDATESHVDIVKEIDDSAYNLNSLAVTNELSVSRVGTYYQAISRGGKVTISRTGDSIQSLTFSSVALGNSTSLAWTNSQSASKSDSLYGHLHMLRKIQANNVPVYWDEVQKDGTYVRFWGIVTTLNEQQAKGGSQAPRSFTFNLTIKEIALFDANSKLMTDIFPLGGIEDASTYT